MKATFTVEVPDEFVAERARQFSDEVEEHEGATAAEYFEGRVRDIAADELPLAFAGWPVEVTVDVAESDALTRHGRAWAERNADLNLMAEVALDGTGWPARFVALAVRLANDAGLEAEAWAVAKLALRSDAARFVELVRAEFPSDLTPS